VEANTFSDGADGVTGHFTSSIFRGNRTDTGGTSTFLLDTDKILVTTATSGTVVVPAGITQVVLNASALTGAIGIQAPRRDRFTQFTIVDPKGIVNGSQQLVVSINSGDTKINGVAQSSIIATNYPNQTIVVTTNGIDGITVQRHLMIGSRTGGADTDGITVQGSNLTIAGNMTMANTVLGSSTLTYASTVNIDFNGPAFRTINLTGDITLTTSNSAAGKQVVVRFVADSTARNFTFPGGWTFLNATAPASIAASKTGALSLTAFGSDDSNVVATYQVQP
jgi:hypothetical protein